MSMAANCKLFLAIVQQYHRTLVCKVSENLLKVVHDPYVMTQFYYKRHNIQTSINVLSLEFQWCKVM